MSLKPFLKWAGGKRQLLTILESYIPQRYGKYIEPFIGGGALFFHLEPHNAIISDSNDDLINTYHMVRDEVDELISLLDSYPHDKNFFYDIRSNHPMDLTPVERAARFIYLNRTCFNGLYRVNKKGEFNVPFGSYKNPKICDAPLLRSASRALKNVLIQTSDYKTVLLENAKEGDLVFLDPPYYPISTFSDFKRYTKEFFYETDHKQLATIFRELSSRGVHVILTNSNAPLIRNLFSDYFCFVADTNRNINSDGSKRTQGEDLIVISDSLVQELRLKEAENA